MKTLILNVLCEGQTEELFVKEVLKPHLKSLGIIVKHRLLVTSRKKSASGGMLSYQQAKNDLTTWMKEVSEHSNETHYFTTMFDLYALPHDFPGYDVALKKVDKYAMVEEIEDAFSEDLNSLSFIPYIQLHEFEALVFCGLDYLQSDYPRCQKEVEGLKKVLLSYGNNPEEIDNSPASAPGKRIEKALSKKYKYNKPKSGAMVTRSVGIAGLRTHCKHFNDWLLKLEAIKA